jgi:hypothetical protein
VRAVAPIAAGLFAAGWDALYIYVLWWQEDDPGQVGQASVLFLSGTVAAAALFLASSSAIPSTHARAIGLIAAAVALAGFAVIGALSIGILLLPAVLLALYAASLADEGLSRTASSKARWTGFAVGLAFPAVFLVALAPT